MLQHFKISNAIGGTHRRRDENGFLFVDESPVLRAGVLEYMGSELLDGGTDDDLQIQPDKIYKVFISPTELEKAAETFKLLPIVNGHEWLGIEGADARDYQEGSTGETVRVEDDMLFVPMKFTGDGIISDLESGAKEELSASYTNKLKKSDNPDYDFVASEIKGNHVALVDRGRCGPDVRVLNQQPELSKMKKKMRNEDLKLIIGDKEINLNEFFDQEERESAHEGTDAIVDTDNEDRVDKRKLIDEIGGILKGKVDEELWRTIIGKAEKIAYEGSETSRSDNEDKRELIREMMAVAGKSDSDFDGGEDEKVREIAKLAERLAYKPSEDSKSDNEDPDCEDRDHLKSKSFNSIMSKIQASLEKKKAQESAGLRRAYNAAAAVIGEFNPFGLSEREMLVRALNHAGIDVANESVPEMYAMLKVCNATTKVDNGFDYGVSDGTDEISVNI